MPPIPPGFSTKIEFGSKPLNPVGVYINAIEAVREWSRNAWNSRFTGTTGLIDSKLGIAIRCVEIVQPKKGPSMQMGDVLLGLQSGVVAMAERNHFRELVVFLQYHGVVRGVVEFTQRLRSEFALDSPSNSSTFGGGGQDNSSSLTQDSGQVYDPNYKYHWLSIDWRFDGRTVPASEIFTTILDAMISTASEKPDAERSYIYGVSSSGNTGFNIHELTYTAPGGRKLTNNLICESLYLIARFIFMKERKFLETDFTVSIFRKTIAEGFFMKISDVEGNHTMPTAVERRKMARRIATSPKILP
ncbi:hypothetical protein G7Y79_00053g088230 [Physcia stellaris]|nr:hypothetical protein G7Y79_00053g088230 [Physcia stellaris]